ncbi:MAG: SUMF1/EgtB/PvdO family nonheme iron enzyme [Pseudomonadota bacterium]
MARTTVQIRVDTPLPVFQAYGTEEAVVFLDEPPREAMYVSIWGCLILLVLATTGCRRCNSELVQAWKVNEPRCRDLPSACGPTQDQDCCDAPLVPGGWFDKGPGPVYIRTECPAFVSDFRLDRYEVTVGRFRRFVEAGVGTQENPPPACAGAHPRIAGSGWDPSWNRHLPANKKELIAALNCQRSTYGIDGPTWTDALGPNESLPINCLDWYLLFAFCAWDGGRLPTATEWQYAAVGGSEQRRYPWGNNAPDSTYANYDPVHEVGHSCERQCNVAPVGSRSPKGDGKWGNADLSGNIAEWTLDWCTDRLGSVPCLDCAQMKESGCTSFEPDRAERVIRGGVFSDHSYNISSLFFFGVIPSDRAIGLGGRCAREP